VRGREGVEKERYRHRCVYPLGCGVCVCVCVCVYVVFVCRYFSSHVHVYACEGIKDVIVLLLLKEVHVCSMYLACTDAHRHTLLSFHACTRTRTYIHTYAVWHGCVWLYTRTRHIYAHILTSAHVYMQIECGMTVCGCTCAQPTKRYTHKHTRTHIYTCV